MSVVNLKTEAKHEDRCRDLDEAKTIEKIDFYRAHPPENSRVFTITSLVAQYLLEKYHQPVGQRSPKHAAIEQYSEAMADSEWFLLGDTLKFGAPTGMLRDGQNRLKACVRANVAFQTHIVFGVPDELFAYMDRGRNRSGGDALTILGMKHANFMAAAIRWCKLIETHRVKTRDTFEPHEILEWAKTNRADIESAIARAVHISHSVPNAERAGSLAALLYNFRKANAKKATEFEAALALEPPPQNQSPESAKRVRAIVSNVRKHIAGIKFVSQGRVPDVPFLAAYVLAWNLHVTNHAGHKKSPYKFDVSKDDFPTIASSASDAKPATCTKTAA